MSGRAAAPPPKWRKWVGAATVVAALVGYQQYRFDVEAKDDRERRQVEQAQVAAESALLDAEASCTAGLMTRGAQPATAVTRCLDTSHADRAVFLSACLEDAVMDGQTVATALDVDYFWGECLDDAAPRE